MLKKTDLVLVLSDIQDANVKSYISKLLTSEDIPMDVLKFVNDNRQLDVSKFYNMIRQNYNKKKSNLYINIVKEVEEPQEVLTTLSAMLTQILLYSKKLDNKQMFLSHSRAEEISLVLVNYFKNYDITTAIKLLRKIKADIVAFEMASGRREIK